MLGIISASNPCRLLRLRVPTHEIKLQKALKDKGLNTPEQVAEVAKRLEAGETITEEDLEREAGGPKD